MTNVDREGTVHRWRMGGVAVVVAGDLKMLEEVDGRRSGGMAPEACRRGMMGYRAGQTTGLRDHVRMGTLRSTSAGLVGGPGSEERCNGAVLAVYDMQERCSSELA